MRPPHNRRNHADQSPEFRATHRFAKIAARKVRLVLDRIRNLPVSAALDQLKFMEQRGAALVDKVLKSAIANADRAISDENVRTRDGDVLEPQPRLDVDDLYVHDAFAGDGPKIPRWKPRARGAAYPYKKYYSHIVVRLRPRPPAGPTPKKGSAPAAKNPAASKES